MQSLFFIFNAHFFIPHTGISLGVKLVKLKQIHSLLSDFHTAEHCTDFISNKATERIFLIQLYPFKLIFTQVQYEIILNFHLRVISLIKLDCIGYFIEFIKRQYSYGIDRLNSKRIHSIHEGIYPLEGCGVLEHNQIDNILDEARDYESLGTQGVSSDF